MNGHDLQQAMQLEQLLLQQIEQAHLNAALIERTAVAELEQLHLAAASAEAAGAGMDLDTYAALLEQQEGSDTPLHELADRLELVLGSGEIGALAGAEATAAGMDLESYLWTLSPDEWATYGELLEAEAVSSAPAHEEESLELALAHQEAAAAGMDLNTYAALLADAEAAELGAAGQDGSDAYAHALAKEEAAAAGMDLQTYAALLGSAKQEGHDELAMLELLAYQQGMAACQARLVASGAGVGAHDIAHLQLMELHRLQAQGGIPG